MIRRTVKWLLWCLAVLVFILIAGVAALWVMPWAVSTDWATKQIETRCSRAIQTRVTIDDLQWTWEGGIQIQGLRIDDDEAFGKTPILFLDRLVLHIDPGQLIDRRLCLELRMEGLEARLIRGADGRTNLESLMARLQTGGKPLAETRPADAPQDWRKMVMALPGDLKARITLKRSALLVEDRHSMRLLSVRDVAFLVNVPSLVNRPITASLSSTQEMDGKPLPPVALSLSVEGLVDPTPAVRFAGASVDARCLLPGLDLSLSGRFSDGRIQGKLDLDLMAFLKAAGPFFPPSFPVMSGQVGVEVQARRHFADEIAYDVTVSGARLTVSGGSLKERRIGPVSLQFSQTGTLNLTKRDLNIVKGDLRLQEKTGLHWRGRIRQTGGVGAEADLTLNTVAVDLKEMAGLAGPFLPGDIAAGWPPGQPQGVFIERVHLKGMLPDGEVRAEVAGLTVELPAVHLARSGGGLSAEGVRLRSSKSTVQVEDRFPTSFDGVADLDVRRLSLLGGQPIHVRGLRATDIRVTGENLARSAKAFPGMSGTLRLSESMAIEEMLAPGLASVPSIRHDFDASVLIQDLAPFIKVSGRTAVTSPSLRIDSLSRHPVKGGIHMETRFENLGITSLRPFMTDVGGLDAAFRLGDIADVRVTVEADALGEKALRTSGRAKLDLSGAGASIPSRFRPNGKFTGDLEVDWRFDGRRPTSRELKIILENDLSAGRRLEALAFIDRLELRTDLKEIGLDVPMKGGTRLSVHGIRSPSPVTLAVDAGLKSVTLEGSLAVDAISQIPGSKAFEPPLSATFSFRADSRDLSSLQIKEALHIDPLSIDQDLHISLNRLGRLLNLEEAPTLSTLLRHLDVDIATGLRTTLGPSLTPFTPGLALTGPLNAGLALELNGGKKISARVSLESDGLDVTAQQAHIQGLTSHIHLTKTYGLQFEGEEKDSPGSGYAPLSQKVLRPSRAPALPSGPGNPLVRRLVDDLGGSMSGRPTLSFESATLKGGPFPLELRHGQMQFRLADSLPALDRFQLDAMGGSILGDLRITRQDDLSRLEMNGAFSGLDAATLLPKQAPPDRASLGAPDRDTQVSGQVSLRMPVSRDSVRVMNNLSAGIRLSHIGSRTLERLLYAMDPYEANEGIVRQRALLRKGTPEWVDVQIRHGNLSLAGSVAAMGTRIPLPPLERLNLSSLPIHARLQKILGRLGPVEKGLNALSANSILIGKDSSIRFVENRP